MRSTPATRSRCMRTGRWRSAERSASPARPAAGGRDRVRCGDHRVMTGVPRTSVRGADDLNRAVVVEDRQRHLALGPHRHPSPRRDRRRRLRERLPFTGGVGAQPLPFLPHSPGNVWADLDVAGPGAHPSLRPKRPRRAPRAHSHPIDGGQDVHGAGSVDIDVLGLDDDTVESEQQTRGRPKVSRKARELQADRRLRLTALRAALYDR